MRLVTIAHGTRLPAGNHVARSITELAAVRLEMPGIAAFVELTEPLLSDVLSPAEPSVVVPLARRPA